MVKYGVIGLGDMGMPWAKNLLNAQYTVNGFDINPGRLAEFADAGGEICSSSIELASKSNIIFIIVMNGNQAYDVIFGEDGIGDSLKQDAIVVIASTIGVSAIQRINKQFHSLKATLLDCPMTGGKARADSGTQTLMISGDFDAIEQCRSALELVSSNIYCVGNEPGMGQMAKCCVQAMAGITYLGAAEVMTLGIKAGLDPEILANVVGTSVAGSDTFRSTIGNALERKFKDTGAVYGTMFKDMALVVEMAHEYDFPLLGSSYANAMFRAGEVKYGNEDVWAIVKVYEELSGVRIERKNS
jgi:putative dehydrogenase